MAIHSQRKFDYYTAGQSFILTMKSQRKVRYCLWIVPRHDSSPRDAVDHARLVNCSPSPCIPMQRKFEYIRLHGQSFTPTMRSRRRIEYTAGLSFNGFCVLIVYHADVVVCCNDMQACVTMRNSNKKCELTPKVLQWHIGITPSGAVFKHVNQHQFGCYHNIPFFSV